MKLNRREFLNRSLPLTGLALVTPGLLNLQACNEINRQFSSRSDFTVYDIIINGAGLFGYFAAIYAAKKGKKVLVVEKRTFAGFEITAKKKLWLKAEENTNAGPEIMQVFLPEDEKYEIKNSDGKSPGSSLFDDEILLFSGSIKKEMLRNLLANKIHILFMTDVCGIFSENGNVKGVLTAGKYGLHSICCKSFIDASDNVIFSRKLFEHTYKIEKAGFVMELNDVINPSKKDLQVDKNFGLIDDQLKLHRGKLSAKQLFIEFLYLPGSNSINEIEQKSRLISEFIGKQLDAIDGSLADARINQFAYESSIYLEDENLPAPSLKGYYMLSDGQQQLTTGKILEIKLTAEECVNKIKFIRSNEEAKILKIPGAEIPVREILFKDISEPGLSVPLMNCSFDFNRWIKNKEQCEVLVGGGGTAGAVAGLGSGEKGAKTMIVDYFNDLGGTKTLGGVMLYYHCVTEHPFFKAQHKEASGITSQMNATSNIGRIIFHLKSALGNGVRYIPGSIICSALVNSGKVEGILYCNNGELGIVNSDVTLDATGDGDIAFFAGAVYHHGDARTGKTQNYSQWDIAGASSDYDIIDNTKLSELQRGLFLSHYHARYYDFWPYLTVRESRRIEGLYTMNLIDAVEGTHFEDMVSQARSDFDPHYVPSSEYTRCGFLLPHSNLLTVEIPYRSIVPKGLDGLLLSGKAISVTQNALQFTRMSGDILILGYLTGQIAADITKQKLQPKNYNISRIQKEWAKTGLFPQSYISKKPGNLIDDNDEIKRRITKLAGGEKNYLFECVRLPKEKVLPVLYEKYNSIRNENGKLLLSKAMAWFGEKAGNNLIRDELDQMFQDELKLGYPGGYIENYDLIRGRGKNQLEGLFWRINQNVALLGMTGNPENNESIRKILENTTSGGPAFKWAGTRADYFNERIDLRLIPYHNRILNLCFYTDRMADPMFIAPYEKLLTDENIKGFCTEEYHLTRWRVYQGDLELFIASTLARCGGESGYYLLIKYLKDVHFNFKTFAASELKFLTDMDFGFNVEDWLSHIKKSEFPLPAKKLIKVVEV